jgi:hypothetical protein
MQCNALGELNVPGTQGAGAYLARCMENSESLGSESPSLLFPSSKSQRIVVTGLWMEGRVEPESRRPASLPSLPFAFSTLGLDDEGVEYLEES